MTYHEASEYFKKVHEENVRLKEENAELRRIIERTKSIAQDRIEAIEKALAR